MSKIITISREFGGGGHFIGENVEQGKYGKAYHVCDKKKCAVGKAEHFNSFKYYRKSEYKVYACKDKRSEEHGQHLRVYALLYFLFRHSDTSHRCKAFSVLISLRNLLIVDYKHGGKDKDKS